ncbi:MAG: hypothetical protein ACLUUF_01080 [Bifidobacterium pullorum]
MFLDSTVAWSFFRYGRLLVCSTSMAWRWAMKSALMNSLPLSLS